MTNYKNSKIRVILAAVVVIGLVIGAIVYWHHSVEVKAFRGNASVSASPKISSIPGAGSPSNQYVKDQNIQNVKKAEKARKQATSAVPTITRPSFVGTLNAFGTLPTKLVTSDIPKDCPLRQEIMFKPNPASCTVKNLKLARTAGVNAEELRCQGCSCPVLKLSGYTAGDLKSTGETASQLKQCGFTLGQLITAGFSAAALKDAGYTAKQLRNVGFSAGQLEAAGYSPKQIRSADYSTAQLAAAGIGANCDPAALKADYLQGVSAATLKQQGCGLAALKLAGYSAAQLRAAGFTAKQLKAAGFTVKQLKAAGYSARQLQNAGFSNATLKAAGFSTAQLATPENCSVAALTKARINGTSALEIKNRGCGLAALKAAGYTAGALKAAGYTAKQLKAAGFTANQLHDAGFTAAALKAAGYSARQLKGAGYTAAQLKAAGYSAAQLRKAGFSAAALKAVGYTAKQLKNAGYSAADLKKAGFSAAVLKAAGFSAGQLKAAGYSAKQLASAGFTAKQLRNAGYSSAALKNAGFSAAALKAAGFTKGDLLRAGFTPKQSGYNQAPIRQVAAVHTVAPAATTQQGSGVKNVLGSSASIPSIGSNSAQSRLDQIERMQQRQMTAQQIADSVQQRQAAMTMEANKLLGGWSNHGNQTMAKGIAPVMPAGGVASLNGKAGSQGGAATQGGSVIKAGSVMFAVLDTSVNSDEKTPILAKIVQGPLKGAKLLGKFQRVNKKLLMTFDLLNMPGVATSIPINAVAIDPDTARTAISGRVNSHYLLRYGTLFGSAFISGLADALTSATSKTYETFFGPVQVQQPLNPTQAGIVALGRVGKRYSQVMASNFNTPPTVKVRGGTGIGLLIMSDLHLPANAGTVQQAAN